MKKILPKVDPSKVKKHNEGIETNSGNLNKNNMKNYTINRWLNNKKTSTKNKWYAITTMDRILFIISILGIFASIRYLENPIINHSIVLIQISYVLFVLTLISNYISHIFGYLANKYDIKYNNSKFLEILENKTTTDLEIIDNKCILYNRYVTYFNIISSIFCIHGILIFSFYIL